MVEIERHNIGLLEVKSWLCERLWTCYNTDCGMTEFDNDFSGSSVYKAEWID